MEAALALEWGFTALTIVSAALMVLSRDTSITVLLLASTLAGVSVLIGLTWGLAFAAGYFFISVGGLTILVLLASSIVLPEREPLPGRKRIVEAGATAFILFLLLVEAFEELSMGGVGGRPYFIRETAQALYAGMMLTVALAVGLYMARRGEEA